MLLSCREIAPYFHQTFSAPTVMLSQIFFILSGSVGTSKSAQPNLDFRPSIAMDIPHLLMTLNLNYTSMETRVEVSLRNIKAYCSPRWEKSVSGLCIVLPIPFAIMYNQGL